jgi:MFS transporter, ACS family, glucarate transporter
MKYRYRVLGFLAALAVLTYLDRVCISVAGPRIQNELGLGPEQWGLVTGSFAVAYALFEIPSGYLADRFGARAMLTRIVLWWSAFTSLTGFTSKLWSLAIVRFLFGVGEAGAYPTASTVVFRWFPPAERGSAFGVVLLSSQLGGAIAPLLVVPIQMHFGWRTSFYLFGIVGILWAVGWWSWFRNQPHEKAGVTQQELMDVGQPPDLASRAFPWQAIASNGSIWALMGAALGYSYAFYFFLFWLPTYLVRARGFSENETKLSALPFVFGAVANIVGGVARDSAVRRFGPTWGPRAIGILGITTAAVSALAALMSSAGYVALAWLALCYGGITFQQPTVFATCVDIGRRDAGTVAGGMNTASAIGGLLSSFVFGYLIQRQGNYDAVLGSMAALLIIGAGLWLFIDATATLQRAAVTV